MKAHLLYRDRDVDLSRPPPWNAEALTRDLGLEPLFKAMAAGDDLVFQVVRLILLNALENEPEEILYRQAILFESLREPQVIRRLYSLAVEAMEKEKKLWRFGTLSQYPDWVLRHSIEAIETLMEFLEQLERLAGREGSRFTSEGWATLFATLRRELSRDYLKHVREDLAQLKFRHGALIGATLGRGNKGIDYRLHKLGFPSRGWARLKELIIDWFAEHLLESVKRLIWGEPDEFTFSLHPRDEAGARALGEVRDRATAKVANALAQSAEHVHDFFDMLRVELAFYIGCINLHEHLSKRDAASCMPVPRPANERLLAFRGLYDVSLALSTDKPVISNDVTADVQNLIIVTGANQGGKSTFLRSVGLAQLMMQAGMFVPADSMSVSTRDALVTHYKREEDTSMESGKLDEELARMSAIVDHITPHAMILFNESFSATNEREGSEIARQIVSALLETPLKIVFVTHLYEFARSFCGRPGTPVLFLRAERERTFRLVEGEPLETSFGEDLYAEIFGQTNPQVGQAEPPPDVTVLRRKVPDPTGV